MKSSSRACCTETTFVASKFVSARTHRATTCLFAYVCVFICMQSKSKSKSNWAIIPVGRVARPSRFGGRPSGNKGKSITCPHSISLSTHQGQATYVTEEIVEKQNNCMFHALVHACTKVCRQMHMRTQKRWAIFICIIFSRLGGRDDMAISPDPLAEMGQVPSKKPYFLVNRATKLCPRHRAYGNGVEASGQHS